MNFVREVLKTFVVLGYQAATSIFPAAELFESNMIGISRMNSSTPLTSTSQLLPSVFRDFHLTRT
jgi:hypothetical protein